MPVSVAVHANAPVPHGAVRAPVSRQPPRPPAVSGTLQAPDGATACDDAGPLLPLLQRHSWTPRHRIAVYAGPGTAAPSVLGCVRMARGLWPHYHVHTVEAAALAADKWPMHTAMLIVPGGRDCPYQAALAGAAERQIGEFVRGGGAYLGICAGAYYASARIDFARGQPGLEVVQTRALGFFPGTCHGPLLPGFSYQSERGAQWLQLAPAGAAFYYGGGYFADADTYGDVRVLAHYGPTHTSAHGRAAAVVACQVGAGVAVLCGVHPEVEPPNGALAQGRQALLRLLTQSLALPQVTARVRRRGPSSSGRR